MDSVSAQQPRHVLVVGASGVIGSAAVEHFCNQEACRVTAWSRRAPIVGENCVFAHTAADLQDRDACAAASAALPPVTHLIYAAVTERPGLVAGWRDDELIAANGRMFANVLDPLAASGSVRHASVIQGAKAYGAHIHPVEVPCREDRPRDAHNNFYWLHEDQTRIWADRAGFAFTIFRPQVLIGSAAGAAMNPIAAIGAYAALCRALGRPFVYPGAPGAILELVDAALLAQALHWAMDADAAAGQIFNITNGDVTVMADLWPHIAEAAGLAAEGEAPPSLAQFFAAPETESAWARLAARHGLRFAALPGVLGQSHIYVDLLLGARIAAKPAPVLLSTIKLRQAGFHDCIDSQVSVMRWLERMSALKLLPPLQGV